MKIQGLVISVTFLGVKQSRCARTFPPSWSQTALSYIPFLKEGNTEPGFGFWREDIPHLGVLLQLMYWTTEKAASFEGSGAGKRSAAGPSWGTSIPATWAICCGKPYGAGGVSGRDRCSVGFMKWAPVENNCAGPMVTPGKDHFRLSGESFLCKINYCAMVDPECLTTGPQMTMHLGLPICAKCTWIHC